MLARYFIIPLISSCFFLCRRGWSFVISRPRAFRRCFDWTSHSTTLHPLYSLSSTASREVADEAWMTEGLLISSWSEGVISNVDAQKLLHRGLLRSMLRQRVVQLEQKLRVSVQNSPCNGPNIQIWQQIEEIDQLLQQNLEWSDPKLEQWIASAHEVLAKTTHENDTTATKRKKEQLLRFVYIPTAMYALRLDSNNTPGKQRQRARADAKNRRNEIVHTLQSILGSSSSIALASVTVDLDDDSVKHAEFSTSGNGCDDDNAIIITTATTKEFPKSGREALIDWQPHFVYMQGGNTFWLYHCMEKGGWIADLKQLCTTTTTNTTTAPFFYCGNSAGAIVAGASLETATWKEWDDPRVVPGRERYEDWSDTTIVGMTLVGTNVSFFPHYEDGTWNDVVRQRTIDLLHRRPGMNVYCLRDDQVCHVDGLTRTITVL